MVTGNGCQNAAFAGDPAFPTRCNKVQNKHRAENVSQIAKAGHNNAGEFALVSEIGQLPV